MSSAARARRVLIVEDNARLQKLMRTMLEREGFTVDEAVDGAQAFRALERNVPDLIFQDLGLPDIDGVELVHRLRENPWLDGVPIIAMSGMQSKLDLARTLQAGFADYLVKPVEPSRLAELIRTYLPSPATGMPLAGLGRRILIIDHDPVQLKLARSHLEPLGFELVEARTGLQAIELAKTVRPDAIMSAVIMPEPDGFQVCEAIRNEPDLAHIPVVLLSALLLDRSDKELAAAVGADVLVPQSNDFRGATQALIELLRTPRKSRPRPRSRISTGLSRKIFDRAERLATLNNQLLSRLTLRDIELSVLGACAAQLVDSGIGAIPDDLFEHCLGAAGILKAAVFVLNRGTLELSTNYGFPALEALSVFFGSADMLRWCIDHKQVLRLDNTQDGAAASRQVLESVQADTVIIAPLIIGEQAIGAFVMVPTRALADDIEGFASALASQISVAVGLVRSMRDVRSGEKKLEQIFESVSEGLLFFDPDLTPRFVNAAAAAIVGTSTDELLGTRAAASSLRFFKIDGTPIPPEEEILRVALSTGKSVPRTQFIIQTPSRARIVVSATAAPVYDEADNLLGVILSVSDISEQKRAEERLTYMAAHDALTDLPNRLLLQDRLQQALLNSRRYKNKMAVLFLDLDGFKHVNDTFGHSVGDEVLVVLASRLAACLRQDDSVARPGGDEFVVALRDIHSVDDITTTVERLMRACAQPFETGDREISLTVSIGVSVSPMDGDNVETLLRNADTAMYKAKEAGRNCFRFFTQSMHAEAVEHLRLESDLRRALDRDEFCLVYQPIVDTRTREIVNAEALLRWKHPTRGILAPETFMKIAEDTGLIIPIGEWVLNEACTAMRRLQEGVPTQAGVSLNLSARQFQNRNLLLDIERIVPPTGLHPSKLTYEITETAAMSDPLRTVETLREIRKMGAHVSIDDFGTGYSSLTYLQQFNASELKLDRVFVRDIAAGAESSKIARAVIALGKSLGMSVVAEGVETAAQVKFLEANGCYQMQGYYFTKPLSMHALGRLMKRWPGRQYPGMQHKKEQPGLDARESG